jgi:hypothetical protein
MHQDSLIVQVLHKKANKMASSNNKFQTLSWRDGTKEGREKRGSHSPLTMKPLISSLNRLTSQDTNTPPGTLRIVWLLLLLLLGSQDPIPDTTDTGRHLMRMESEDKGGSEAEET